MFSKTPKTRTGQLPGAGDVIDDRYRLGNPVASGGMGVIVEAEQIRTGRTVAVKLLHPHIAQQDNFAERFAREVQVATLFDHANIVRVYDVGETEEGALYLVMEYLHGEDLKALIAREAPLSMGEALELGLQIVDGLSEAHAQKVVHRDIKPANVFVTQKRRGAREAKLVDFGLAKLVNAGASDLTAAGVYAGTPSYIAPETLVNPASTEDPAVDIYAAGLVILEMLTGEKVFSGDSVPQTLIQHLKHPVRIPARIAKTPVGRVLRIATQKHPGDRYGDADQFYEALERAGRETDPSLQLNLTEIPRGHHSTSPSLLHRVATSDPTEAFEVLRQAPGHEIYVPEDAPSDLHLDDVDTTKFGVLDPPDETISLAEHDLMLVDDNDDATALIDSEDVTMQATPSAMDSTPPNPKLARATSPVATDDFSRRTGPSPTTIALLSAGFVVFLGIAFAAVFVFSDSDDAPPDEASDQDLAVAQELPQEIPPQQEEGAAADSEDAEELNDDDSTSIAVSIGTDPSGATVYADGTEVGETTLNIYFDDDNLPQVLKIKKEGYETETWELGAEFDARDDESSTMRLRMRLRELPSPSSQASSPPPRPSPPPPRPQPTPAEPDDDDGDDIDDMLRRYLD